MTAADTIPKIKAVAVVAPRSLRLAWAKRPSGAVVDVGKLMTTRLLRRLSDPDLFAQATVEDWGSVVRWPNGAELSAETLWIETLARAGHEDSAEFLLWRLRGGYSLIGAAQALGLSRRTVANYGDGRHAVPKTVLLAIRYLGGIPQKSKPRRAGRADAAYAA
jgi:Protein of unknown function (DUF2442)